MTNYEWLLQMGGEERQAWFDAQHVYANNTLSAEDDVSAADADANDVDVAHDSREKLEADVKHLCSTHEWESASPIYSAYELILAALDRQAAITRRECEHDREALDYYSDRYAEMDEQMVELTAERDALADDLLTCNKEREEYRELFSQAITHAHEIVNLQP